MLKFEAENAGKFQIETFFASLLCFRSSKSNNRAKFWTKERPPGC
jgi:hypothetical protein